MRGLIILEGVDGTGKTTLAKTLCARWGGRYLHMTYRYPRHQFTYHLAMVHHAISRVRAGETVVLDRCWLSEDLYAAEFRGGSEWPMLGRFMDRAILSVPHAYVMCRPIDAAKHEQEFQRLRSEREEMYTSLGGLVGRYEARRPILRRRNDWADYTIGDDVERLSRMLEVYCGLHDKHDLSPGPGVIGNTFNPFFLFIGDETNRRKRAVTKWSWPFMEYAASSLYLTEILHELGYDETRGAWVNIHDYGGIDACLQLMDSVVPPRPIVMGNSAASTWRRLGLHLPSGDKHFPRPRTRYIVHPSYARRFHRHDNLLLNQLKEALA